MLKFAKKPGNIILIAAAVFLMTVAGLAFQPGQTQAAPASGIACVDFNLLMSQHPDMAAAQQTMKDATDQAQKEFNEKSANMNDQDKKALFNQMGQQLSAKEMELMGAIRDKVVAAVKQVAEQKGYSVVIDKRVAIYGADDITAEVGKKIAGQ